MQFIEQKRALRNRGLDSARARSRSSKGYEKFVVQGHVQVLYLYSSPSVVLGVVLTSSCQIKLGQTADIASKLGQSINQDAFMTVDSDVCTVILSTGTNERHLNLL